jgi:anti-anti-sigma factor
LSSVTDSCVLAAVERQRNRYCGNPCCGNGYCGIVPAVSELASSLGRTRTAARENGLAPSHANGIRSASSKRFAVSTEEAESGAPRVSVRGEIDKATVDVVRREAFRQIEPHGPGLVLDLVRTSFMDSSGLHLIEALRRRTSEQGGALVLVVASYGVRRLLGIAPPSSDVLVVVARPQRDAAVGNQRPSPPSSRTVAA